MGFGLQRLQDAAVDNAKQGVAEAKALETASEETDVPHREDPPVATSADAVPAPARANPFAGGASRPSFGSPSASPTSSARPSFGAPASSPRPSLGAPPVQAAPVASKQDGRPSFGSQPPQANLPNARAVFVRNPGSQSDEPSATSKVTGQDLLSNPQALFEVVCTHRKMSTAAIEAARVQALTNPDGVFHQMRRIYDQEIAPNRSKHATDLPQAREANLGQVVFLLRKEALERVRIMSFEDAERTGEALLNGATVENVQAASSPFSCPSELFAAPAPMIEVEHTQESSAAVITRSSPKP